MNITLSETEARRIIRDRFDLSPTDGIVFSREHNIGLLTDALQNLVLTINRLPRHESELTSSYRLELIRRFNELTDCGLLNAKRVSDEFLSREYSGQI